jgi:hypothetical protein
VELAVSVMVIMSCSQLVSHEAGPKEIQNFPETDYRVTSKENSVSIFLKLNLLCHELAQRKFDITDCVIQRCGI